jgi:hypothetical protein
MGNQTDYFDRVGSRATYDIGDRVIGRWNGIPFVGTVGNDRLINHVDGPEITVHLDLPIRYQDQSYRFVIVRHNQVRKLPEITDKK